MDVSAVADHTVGIPVGGEPGSWDCEPGAGLVMSGFTVIYVLVALWLFMYRRKRLMGGLVEFSEEYAWVQKQLLYEMGGAVCHRGHRGTFPLVDHSFRRSSGKIKTAVRISRRSFRN